jgi:hypothetical protein
VADAASELEASEAYVRRLLLRQRLYGIKVGTVWAIFLDDLEAFKRTRRAPGRPRKSVEESAPDEASVMSIVTERKQAGTDRLLRKRRQESEPAKRSGRAPRANSKQP